MPLFTSDRERRLWLWTLAVVVAIYSTLGLAATLVETLSDRRQVDSVFVFCFFLVILTILTQGLQARPGGVEICVGIGIAAAVVMVVVRTAIPAAERTHLIEYGVVAVFVYEALTERARHRHVPRPALLAIAITLLIGVLDECLQALLPARYFDPADILFDTVAAVLAVSASAVLRRVRAAISPA